MLLDLLNSLLLLNLSLNLLLHLEVFLIPSGPFFLLPLLLDLNLPFQFLSIIHSLSLSPINLLLRQVGFTSFVHTGDTLNRHRSFVLFFNLLLDFILKSSNFRFPGGLNTIVVWLLGRLDAATAYSFSRETTVERITIHHFLQFLSLPSLPFDSFPTFARARRLVSQLRKIALHNTRASS